MKPIIKFLLIGLVISGIILIGLFSYLVGRGATPTKSVVNNNVNAITKPIQNTNTNTVKVEVADTVDETVTTSTIDPAVTAGVTWVLPEELEDLGLVADEGTTANTYYKIATLADGGSIILLKQESLGVSVSRFRSEADGKYYLLSQHTNDSYLIENAATLLSDSVTVDTTTQYAELNALDTLSVDGLSLVKRNFAFNLDVFLSDVDETEVDLTVIETGEFNILYVAESPVETMYDNGLIVAKKYLLKLADSTIETYGVDLAVLADDGSLNVDLDSDAKDFADRQFSEGVVINGCGVVGGNQYLADVTPKAFDKIGVTKAGDPVYTVTNDENPLLRNAYESYKVGRDYEGSTITLLTYEEFVAEQPVVIWPDAAGDYLLFMDQAMAPMVECGKPLIYLYPTRPTLVSVQVGAHVTKSEPAYLDGWNVLAQPSGTQLYWEGTGWGTYPQITTGKVVASAMVEQTIQQDLLALGLTQTEIADFLEFWLPRMPKAPYVRLSWLNTEQMNRLAPLSIKPRPDTVIRVFLDFAGQQTSDTTLVPQTLTALPRNGFTVIEWGGLLLGQ